jgi:hypothetical protein
MDGHVSMVRNVEQYGTGRRGMGCAYFKRDGQFVVMKQEQLEVFNGVADRS